MTGFVAVLVAVACTVSGTNFAGRVCESAVDCPEPLACVQSSVGPWRECDRAGGPDASSGDVDGGRVYYCSAAKQVLDTYCISCHSVPPTAGAPDTFRLDVYTTDGGLPAAFEKARQVRVRTYDLRDMPPSGVLSPNLRQRSTLASWANSGALYCEDAGF